MAGRAASLQAVTFSGRAVAEIAGVNLILHINFLAFAQVDVEETV
jgi:hypothetical protein